MGMKPVLSFAIRMAPFARKVTPDWFLETEPHKSQPLIHCLPIHK